MTEPSGASGSSWGSGPGVITRDGCAVDLYARLPVGRDAEVIASALRDGAEILDLGAGAGRLTHALTARGHSVVAVDESAEMLAHIRGAETVHGSIAALELGRRFDAVVLASHLVNTPSPEERHRLLRACRRHCRPDGNVVLQRHTREWAESVRPGRQEKDGIAVELRDPVHGPGGAVTATVRYSIGASEWIHHFTAVGLDDVALTDALDHTGLRLDRWLTEDGTWVSAVPVPPRPR
ncbi:class I SAM-dependent methyltransferase [Spiractinospora alimapuensis]|uniref:class I SAM-dependent methyltransferase n=1 Tax=Spiractinospora alimapuensis TaxID=2820884 RepID=UPI001F3928F3|nr:class I SAM-dependent methyltransferase [Spiractinospora alimapuensis]QVQ52797.1 class I SAM-dependent methyltransferase [Spiractinospora alimapuensis]